MGSRTVKPIDPHILDVFVQEMREKVIPEIVQVIEEHFQLVYGYDMRVHQPKIRRWCSWCKLTTPHRVGEPSNYAVCLVCNGQHYDNGD